MRSLDSASAFHAAQSSRTRLCLAILALLSSSPVLAQVASVTTSVAGQNGSPAPQQRVTLANPATGFAAEAVTNVQGQAHFAAVPAGEGYVVVIDGQTLSTNVRLRANETRTLVLALPVDSVVVTATKRVLAPNLTDAEVSAGLSRDALVALPVEARDLSHALLRLPNVVPSTGFFPEAPEVSINGANGLFAQYLVDGLDNN